LIGESNQSIEEEKKISISEDKLDIDDSNEVIEKDKIKKDDSGSEPYKL